MNSRLNDEVFQDCVKPRYVNRDEPRQYECTTINHKESVDTQYIKCYTGCIR